MALWFQSLPKKPHIPRMSVVIRLCFVVSHHVRLWSPQLFYTMEPWLFATSVLVCSKALDNPLSTVAPGTFACARPGETSNWATKQLCPHLACEFRCDERKEHRWKITECAGIRRELWRKLCELMVKKVKIREKPRLLSKQWQIPRSCECSPDYMEEALHPRGVAKISDNSRSASIKPPSSLP